MAAVTGTSRCDAIPIEIPKRNTKSRFGPTRPNVGLFFFCCVVCVVCLFVCLFFGAGRWPVSVAAFRVARLFAAPVIHRRLRRLAGGRLAVVV